MNVVCIFNGGASLCFLVFARVRFACARAIVPTCTHTCECARTRARHKNPIRVPARTRASAYTHTHTYRRFVF